MIAQLAEGPLVQTHPGIAATVAMLVTLIVYLARKYIVMEQQHSRKLDEMIQEQGRRIEMLVQELSNAQSLVSLRTRSEDTFGLSSPIKETQKPKPALPVIKVYPIIGVEAEIRKMVDREEEPALPSWLSILMRPLVKPARSLVSLVLRMMN